MPNRILKLTAATMGTAAVVAAAAIVSTSGPADHRTEAGGSGASATTTTYVQPIVSSMKLASTVVDTPVESTDAAPTALAVTLASPTLKATAAAGCVNNGQCP